MSTEPPTPNAPNDDLAALLGSARRGLTPTADDRARSAAALSAQLAAAAVPKAIGAKGLSAALKGLAGGKLAGLASVAGLAAIATVGAVSVARAPQPPQPAQMTETARQTAVAPAPVVAKTASTSEREPAPATAPEAPASGTPQTAPKVSVPVPSAAVPTTPPSAPTTVSIAEETRLVRGAETALRQGNSAEALALLAEHARRFPQGVLAEEREGERAIATCASASPEARTAAAARFRRAHPGSAMLPRVEAACR